MFKFIVYSEILEIISFDGLASNLRYEFNQETINCQFKKRGGGGDICDFKTYQIISCVITDLRYDFFNAEAYEAQGDS